jgi:hypothetical protein
LKIIPKFGGIGEVFEIKTPGELANVILASPKFNMIKSKLSFS